MAQYETERLPELEDFPAEERGSAVKVLLRICHAQQRRIEAQELRIQEQAQQIQLQAEQIALQAEQIARLKDEIAILKGEKGRPNIKPSRLLKNSFSSLLGRPWTAARGLERSASPRSDARFARHSARIELGASEKVPRMGLFPQPASTL